MIVRARTEINEELIRDLLAGEKFDLQAPKSCFFFNSGSAALRFFLQMNRHRNRVGVQVFTCSTVLDAIVAEGCIPVFLDINKEYYTSTLDFIKGKIKEMDILLLTHLFGIPNPDYLEIKQLCEENDVVLIDDLCQTYHAKIGENYLEDISDNYIYSFFYDKPISTLAGGMLKVSSQYSEAESIYYKFPIVSEKKGKQNLKVLLLMHGLLSPDFYSKEFRIGELWKRVIACWPNGCRLHTLNFLINSKMMRVLLRMWNLKSNNHIICRLSLIEQFYVCSMMRIYTNHNNIILDFCKRHQIEIPQYLNNQDITCSIAKRAILQSRFNVEGVQISLYNWPYLLCNKEEYHNYPGATFVLNSCINIPSWTKDIIRM